jgi:glycosyltransferase involved in cell wall biosynthesis
MALIENSHFSILPTLHDTYGFSVLESMSRGIPAIVTATAALPEVVHDGENGFLLPLEVDSIGDWAHLSRKPVSWRTYDETFTELARLAIEKLETVIDSPSAWERLSAGATAHIDRQHDAYKIGEQLEAIYDAALMK